MNNFIQPILTSGNIGRQDKLMPTPSEEDKKVFISECKSHLLTMVVGAADTLGNGGEGRLTGEHMT